MIQGPQPVESLYLKEEETNIRSMDRNPHDAVRYRATIAASSLKVAESRTIADLLLRGVHGPRLAHGVGGERTFSRSEVVETAARLGQLLRARLELMQPALWEMVRDGSVPACNACLPRRCRETQPPARRLSGYRRCASSTGYFARPSLTPVWEHFIEDCRRP